MYLLYLDDSGSVADPHQSYFVLAGVAAFERQIHWIDRAMSETAESLSPGSPDSIEFHGAPMMRGADGWNAISRSRTDRAELIKQALDVLHRSHRTTCLFGVAVHKQTAALEGRDPIELAFEQICSRFDKLLMRKHRLDDREKGLIILDKSTMETRLQGLARCYRTSGHSWGVTRNIVEVPLFVDSKATRLVQLADLVAYALFRYYERGDSQFFDVIHRRFDQEGGIIHGLLHYGPLNGHLTCSCPACLQRRE